MKMMLAAFAALALAACASREPVYLQETEPTTAPQGYVDYCYRNPWDMGCPPELRGPI